MNPPASPKADGGFAVKAWRGCAVLTVRIRHVKNKIDKELDNVCTK